jgi:hypothetical protein
MATTDIPISFKPTEEDRKILEWLKKKLGANTAGVIRQALRSLRDKEKTSMGLSTVKTGEKLKNG